MKNISTKFNVKTKVTQLSSADPLEELSTELVETVKAISDQLNFKSTLMPSGAGHDTMIVGQQKKSNGEAIKTVMLFIPCHKGISHSPEEFSTIEQIEKGALLLSELLLELAQG